LKKGKEIPASGSRRLNTMEEEKKKCLDFFLPGEENRYQELTLYMLFRIPSATSGSRKEERIKNCTGGEITIQHNKHGSCDYTFQ